MIFLYNSYFVSLSFYLANLVYINTYISGKELNLQILQEEMINC